MSQIYVNKSLVLDRNIWKHITICKQIIIIITGVYHISFARWIFKGAWETKSLLSSPELL